MEMISLKSPREIECMRRAGRLTAQARALAGSLVRPGVTTHEIDTAVRKFIESHGAKPSFLGYGGFKGSACISINEEVIHGIPGPRKLKEGDIVSVDVGAYLDGFHGDCAATFPCGEVSPEAMELIRVTEQSFWEGIKLARAGNRVFDISHAVQQYVESHGCSVVRDFVGHGVGAKLHEAPEVPNFGPAGHGPRLQPGMTIAVEPMVCAGDWRVKVLKDGWTTVSADGSLTAHYEYGGRLRADCPLPGRTRQGGAVLCPGHGRRLPAAVRREAAEAGAAQTEEGEAHPAPGDASPAPPGGVSGGHQPIQPRHTEGAGRFPS